MTNTPKLRTAQSSDLAELSTICFNAFATVNGRHGFAPDIPSVEAAQGLMGFVLSNSQIYSTVAESNGQILGSNFLWEGGAIASVGPITVRPDAQGGVGRKLMEDALARAKSKGFVGVRLVQSAFNTTSMSLYTKLGFDVREPLVVINGAPIAKPLPGYRVRPMTESDFAACDELCRDVHGHDRHGELPGGVAMGTATVAERDNTLLGYATGIGFMSHAVARDNAAMKALIAAAPAIQGPGLLLPSRNGELFRWCLASGLRMIQPATLMSLGLYNEPSGAFLPSVLF